MLTVTLLTGLIQIPLLHPRMQMWLSGLFMDFGESGYLVIHGFGRESNVYLDVTLCTVSATDTTTNMFKE